MGLKELLNDDVKLALKSNDKIKVSVLRMILAQIKNIEIDKHLSVTDEDVLKILNSQVKKSNEALALFEKGGRSDLVQKEKDEQKIIQGYLPKSLTDAEIISLVEETIKEVQAVTIKDLGKVMKAIIVKTKGQADSSKINTLVKQRLGS